MVFIETQIYTSPIGSLILASYQGALCMCDWQYRNQRVQLDKRLCNGLGSTMIEGENEDLTLTINQLKEYFGGVRKEFDIPLKMVGTAFQQQVWNQLLQIPYGKTLSYLQLSQHMEHESAIRAVAAANGANGISIIIPCHRVVGGQGQLVGYAGGLVAKQKLLELERKSEQYTLFD